MFARRSKDKKREFWLLYRGEDGSEGVCRFDQSSFARESQESIPDGARVFSATGEDMRMDPPKQRVSIARLERMARQQSGEGGRLRIVRAPKPASVWFTPASRVRAVNHYLYPLAATLEVMLHAAGKQKPALVGVLFGKEEHPDLILFIAFREIDQVQVLPAIYPESVEEATLSAMHDARLAEDTLVVLFTQAELWEACARAKPYPPQEPILGMDPTAAAMGFAGFSALTMAVAGGVWKYQDVHYRALEEEQASIAAEIEDIKRRTAKRISENPEALVSTFREDWRRVFDEAATLWREGGRVETEFADRRATHYLIFPVREASEGNDVRWLEPDRILSLRDGKLPQDCQMSQISLAGNGNEVKVQYLCSHPRDDLLGGGR